MGAAHGRGKGSVPGGLLDLLIRVVHGQPLVQVDAALCAPEIYQPDQADKLAELRTQQQSLTNAIDDVETKINKLIEDIC